ncbi:hypothetical protein AB0F72_34000 [Actinoplanes sp. NPDC023936]|uniref:hypothetical protein n=1 Tax=Actinoplanes sp. NPDC023936 TaxID=3154910 RepID=UPI0033D4428B
MTPSTTQNTRSTDHPPCWFKTTAGKRHLIVETKVLLMTVKVTPANVTDRELLPAIREQNPELTLMWADERSLFWLTQP